MTPLPEKLSFEAAVLVEPGVAAYHACERLRLQPHDRIAVMGTGTLGLLALLFARLTSHEVDVVGVVDSELDFALQLGACHALHPNELPTAGYDAVIEASGAPGAFQAALEAVDVSGRIALIGLPSRASEIGQTLLTLKNVTVHGVLHGLDHYRQVVTLFATGAVDPVPLIARVISPAQVHDIFHHSAKRRAPKSLIRFSG